MSDTKIAELRITAYLAGILVEQASDPLCGGCVSYGKVTETVNERFEALDASTFEGKYAELYETLRKRVESIRPAAEPIPQRKIGACSLPGRRCLIKYSRKVYEAQE